MTDENAHRRTQSAPSSEGQSHPAATDGGSERAMGAQNDHPGEEPTPKPEAEDAIASASDFLVQRDENGEVLTVTQSVAGVEDPIRVRPLSQGEANRYLPSSGDPRDLDDAAILALIQEFIAEPDFSHVESVEEFVAFGVDPLLMAVFDASGFNMTRGMITENAEALGAVEGNSSSGN